MKLKIYLFLVFSFNRNSVKFAQNTLSIQAVNWEPIWIFDLNVSLQNQDNIATLQFDINYAAALFVTEWSWVNNFGSNHSFSVGTPSQGIVKLFTHDLTRL
jgi:hypothetical protein